MKVVSETIGSPRFQRRRKCAAKAPADGRPPTTTANDTADDDARRDRPTHPEHCEVQHLIVTASAFTVQSCFRE